MRYAWMNWMILMVVVSACGGEPVEPVEGETPGAVGWKSQVAWPAVGGEAGLDEPEWVPTKMGVGQIDVAFGAGIYLAVWADPRTGVDAVYGRRIQENGAPLDDISFPISSKNSFSNQPKVVFDGQNFLVVWVDGRNLSYDIYGARVSTDGEVIDVNGFAVHASGYSKSGLALEFNGTHATVIWRDTEISRVGVYAKRVSRLGAVMDSQPIQLAVTDGRVPQLSWNGNEHFVFWNDWTSGYRVYGARVDPNGVVETPGGLRVLPATYAKFLLSTVWDGNNHLVLYNEYYSALGNTVFLAKVTPTGEMATGPNPIQIGETTGIGVSQGRIGDITRTPDGNFAIWFEIRSGSCWLYSNLIGDDGVMLSPMGVLFHAGAGCSDIPVVTSGVGNMMAAWRDKARGVNDALGQMIDFDGEKIGQPFYLNVAGNAQYRPKMAAGVGAGGAAQKLVLWQDERGVDLDLYAARLDEHGVTLDGTAIAVAVAGGTQAPGGVAWSGGAYWMTWEDLRGGDADVYVARVTPDGALVDAVGGFGAAGGVGDQGAPVVAGDGAGGAWVAYTDDSGSESAVKLVDVAAGGSVGAAVAVSDVARPGFAPAVARGDGGVFVAWHAFDGLTQQVEGAFVADDGAILWGPQVLAPSQSVQLRPTVAWDGDSFLVAWEDNRDRVYNVYAAVVDVAGSVSAAVALGAADRNQFLPSAVHDGEHFVVVWEESTDTGSDLRAQRVDATGAAVDAQAAVITQGASPERAPVVVADGPRSVSVAYSRPVVEYPYGASRVRVRQVAYNRAPEASVQSIVTLEDTPAPADLAAFDADGDALTYAVVTPPVAGALSGTAPGLTYTPAPGFVGEDAFTYRVSDGYDTVEQPVRVLVLAQAERPVAHGDAVETPEDTPVDVRLVGDVAAGAQAVFTIVDAPAHGLFKGTAPDLQYNPDADWHGEDFFTFRVGDGVRESDLAVVRLVVTPVNDAPVALAQDVTTGLEEARPVLLAGEDVDGDQLTFEVRARPAHGTLTGVPPLVRYRPGKHFVGEDAFSFTVSDGELTSEPAIVRVTVDGTLRRELDGDASWFGCTAAPGVRLEDAEAERATVFGRLHSLGNFVPLLLIGLGLVVARRRRR